VQGKSGPPRKPKYQVLFESLRADILSGRFQPGQKLPSEAALVNRTGASRITAGRAIRELQNLGLVERIAGSGTYVSKAESTDRPLLFGLLIPDLGETEIFDPICQAIARAPEANGHALLWGHSAAGAGKAQQAWSLCQQYLARKVAGVFFAPLEYEREAEKMNRRILSALKDAVIAVVLLDRRPSDAPERSRPDLVGLNNRQAGYIATEHLIRQGCRHIAFLGYHGAAATIEERTIGYREALAHHGLRPALESALHAVPGAESPVSWSGKTELRSADAFVCVNDRVAGQLMHLFLSRGIRIPEDVRLVGMDDVLYASLLPVPLTTVRQPVREIGETALRAMLERIRRPKMPARELLLDGELVVRKSCGGE